MEILLIAAACVVLQVAVIVVYQTIQHRKTKNAALAIIDQAWAMAIGRPESEVILGVRRLVEQMTMAETLGMSAKDSKRDAAKFGGATLARNQPCGCVVCRCENDEQCQGCGAKHCGTHPVGEIPNPKFGGAT